MADSTSDQVSMFLKTGIYRFESSNTVFIDQVRVLNRSYARFRVSPSAYYSRFFDSKASQPQPRDSTHSRKRKRKQKPGRPHTLNGREQVADRRHQEVRDFLAKAHEDLLGATDLLGLMLNLRSEGHSSGGCGDSILPSVGHSFIELARVWQAPLYEITLNFPQFSDSTQSGGFPVVQHSEQQRVSPIFNSLVINETRKDVEAEFLSSKYVIPRNSCFYMSDMREIQNLIPAESDNGFNLILIDPPWENSSAHQKLKYPTLPNRFFLSLPIKELAHAEGAVLALWVTNREKLRTFIEKELFPSWGVKFMATFYWLKAVDSECSSRFKSIPDNQVFISIPGDYSRKPPIGELLLDYVPGFSPARCIELFAREMIAGWTSWGNEPLHFQESRYFVRRTDT
ncbi:methyltransferase-like protein 2 isoform X2 [Diospyros lotus]|uniref:methyltransferase-like protein 2 isoform X2 n=1 Tax=Diospyros lotus TaxID=55363 RepID=UPI0022579A79|nr:methyltransferase-like protein 2 isoform X2 [Diospyros lotus]